jgi:TRAP-type uncharacterized transport system substrate-binding protein
MKLHLLFRRRWWLFYLPILFVAGFLMWWSFTQWLPLPPKKITLASGVPGGGYTQLALLYRQKLDALGISANLVTTEKAHSALALLGDETQADVALVNGLVTSVLPGDAVQALAAIQREPIWVFTRLPGVTELKDLRGLKIGVPLKDQLQDKVLTVVLRHAQLQKSDVKIIALPRDAIANALIDGQVDVFVLMGSSRNDVVRLLTRSSGIQLVGMDQVGKLMSTEPALRPFVLPQGVIEFRGDIPPRDLTIVAADLHLLIKPDMHPALQRAMLQVAAQIHEIPSFLQNQGEFPRFVGLDYPISPTALSFWRGGDDFVEQLLPFWWAQLAQWLLIAFLPIMAATVLLLAWIPSLFDWRANAILQNFYGELKFLESDIESVATQRPIEMQRLMQRIDAIEVQLMQLELPDQFAPRWYTLRSHLVQAREKLLSLRAR